MILTTGIWTNKMLAEWFEIKEKTFANTKKKRLEELEEYADFYEEKGKIIMTKVKQGEYVKKSKATYKIVYNLVEENWSADGFDTCLHVKELMKKDARLKKIKETTIYNYTVKAHNEMYGSPSKEGSRGTKGKCRYKWGKRDDVDSKKPRYFSEEEQEYFSWLIKEIFLADPKSIQEIADRRALKDAWKNGEISKEEYNEQRDYLDDAQDGKWALLEQEMFKKYNIKIIKGTQDEFLAF